MKGERWILAAAAAALWAGLAGVSPARAEGMMPKTHGAMLDSVARLVAADLLRGVELPPGRPVRIATPLTGDTLGFLAQSVVERLRGSGTEVRLVPSRATADLGMPPEDPPARLRADSTDLMLQLHVTSAGVSYVRAIRGFPFGIRGYERLASMRVGATLVDLATREVLWAKTASAEASDVVRKGDLSYVQSGSGGMSPGLPRTGGGTRLLEPLIVVGVVTGLIVLFYSNRN